MYDGASILAVITARGGSKGLPGKNLRLAGGKPLIAWTIEQGSGSKFIDRLVLSSEDEEIIAVARNLGCEAPFVRPDALARDDVSAVEPVIHASRTLSGYDMVVLLQPTCPLRTSEDIDGCIRHCVDNNAPACISVARSAKSPYWMYSIDSNGRMVPLLDAPREKNQRQDWPAVYVINGAVYVARTQWLYEQKSFLSDQTLAYEMPEERSLDIDTEHDLEYFEFLLK